MDRLTLREYQVAMLVARGLSIGKWRINWD
jgi:DNA-binding CsgD family transcriptional regulator